jgi:hypothetical protein
VGWMFDAHYGGFQGWQALERSVRRRTNNSPETFQQRSTTLRRLVLPVICPVIAVWSAIESKHQFHRLSSLGKLCASLELQLLLRLVQIHRYIPTHLFHSLRSALQSYFTTINFGMVCTEPIYFHLRTTQESDTYTSCVLTPLPLINNRTGLIQIKRRKA